MTDSADPRALLQRLRKYHATITESFSQDLGTLPSGEKVGCGGISQYQCEVYKGY